MESPLSPLPTREAHRLQEAFNLLFLGQAVASGHDWDASTWARADSGAQLLVLLRLAAQCSADVPTRHQRAWREQLLFTARQLQGGLCPLAGLRTLITLLSDGELIRSDALTGDPATQAARLAEALQQHTELRAARSWDPPLMPPR